MMIGYDKDPINHQILVDISMDEQIGAAVAGQLTHDRAKPHHVFALTGGLTWVTLPSGLVYLDFDAATGFLECPAVDSADVNFTTEDYTLLAWAYNNIGATAQLILNQGTVDVDGFEFFAFNTNLSLRHNQGGAHTDCSAVGVLIAAQWQLVAVTRHGAAAQFYVDGKAVPTIGALSDAVSCAGGSKLLVGVQNNEISNFWDGNLSRPRIWGRTLTSRDLLRIFDTERHWYGV